MYSYPIKRNASFHYCAELLNSELYLADFFRQLRKGFGFFKDAPTQYFQLLTFNSLKKKGHKYDD